MENGQKRALNSYFNSIAWMGVLVVGTARPSRMEAFAVVAKL